MVETDGELLTANEEKLNDIPLLLERPQNRIQLNDEKDL